MRAPLLLGTLLSFTLVAGVAAADPPPAPADAPSPAPAPTEAPPAAPSTDTPPLAPPVADSPAPAAAAPASGTLTAHVLSPMPASVEHRVTPTSPWENVCSTPCDIQVNPAEEYRVLGTDVAPSSPFIFDGAKGNDLTVKVLPGSLKKARIGLWLLGGGGALAVVGLATLIGASTMSGFSSDNVVQEGRFDALFAGTTLLIGGVGLSAWGAGFWATNSSSGIEGPVMAPPKHTEPMPAPKAAFTVPLVHIDF